jgi:hypothetical protein
LPLEAALQLLVGLQKVTRSPHDYHDLQLLKVTDGPRLCEELQHWTHNSTVRLWCNPMGCPYSWPIRRCRLSTKPSSCVPCSSSGFSPSASAYLVKP